MSTRHTSNSSLLAYLMVITLSLAIFASAEASLLSGDILVAGNSTIWRVDPTTGVETALNTTIPWGRDVAVSASGEIIALGSNDVYRINAITGAATKINSVSFASLALGMGLAPNGDIYIAEGGSGTASRVQKVNPVTGAVVDVTTSWTNPSTPTDVFVESSSSLLVTSLSTQGGVYRVNLTTGDETAVHLGSPLVGATGITPGGPLGYVVTDYSANKVFAWDGTSNPPTVISENDGGANNYFVDPRQSIVDADGMILVADTSGPSFEPGRVIKVDPANGSQTVLSEGVYVAGHGVVGLESPYGIAIYYPVPEPGTLILLTTGALGFLVHTRRRRKH